MNTPDHSALEKLLDSSEDFGTFGRYEETPVAEMSPEMREAFDFSPLDHELPCHVQPDHLGRDLGGEHGRERLGVAPGVEFREARLISRRFDIAPHRDMSADFLAHQGGVRAQHERQAGDGTERHECDGLRLGSL